MSRDEPLGSQTRQACKRNPVVAGRGVSAILALGLLFSVSACSGGADGASQRIESAKEIVASLQGSEAVCDSAEPIELSREELDELGAIDLVRCTNDLGEARIVVYESEHARLVDALRTATFGCLAAPGSSWQYVHGDNWIASTTNDPQLLEAIEGVTGGSLNLLDCTAQSPEIDLPGSMEDASVDQLRVVLGE